MRMKRGVNAAKKRRKILKRAKGYLAPNPSFTE